MKRIIMFLLMFFLITGCSSSLKKWTYSFNNNYEVKRISNDEIFLYKDNKVLIDKYITGFVVLNDNYLYLQTARNYASDDNTGNVIILYYLVNMENGEINGPLTLDNTSIVLESIGVTDTPKFINSAEITGDKVYN